MRNNLQWWRGGSSQGQPGYRLKFDYDRDIIEGLKSRIPVAYREWDPESKTWWVHEYCEKAIDELFPGFLQAVIAQKLLF